MKMMLQPLACAWNVLDDSHKILLGNCLVIFGIIGLSLNVWLLVAFLRSPFLMSRTYLLLLANCIACLLRSVLVFPFSSLSALLTRWVFSFTGCQLFGFLKLVITLFQMFCFTVLTVERLAYHHKGTNISFTFYIILTVICWILAIIISSLPLIGIGRFTYDTTCTLCELDWSMKGKTQMVYNITVMILGGALPVLIIILSLIAALKKGTRPEERAITKAVALMMVLTFLFWIPRAILILWMALLRHRIPKALAVMAPLGSEATTMIPVLTYLVYLPALRNALITLLARKRRRNV